MKKINKAQTTIYNSDINMTQFIHQTGFPSLSLALSLALFCSCTLKCV